jgi:hypothetical protein
MLLSVPPYNCYTLRTAIRNAYATAAAKTGATSIGTLRFYIEVERLIFSGCGGEERKQEKAREKRQQETTGKGNGTRGKEEDCLDTR